MYKTMRGKIALTPKILAMKIFFEANLLMRVKSIMYFLGFFPTL